MIITFLFFRSYAWKNEGMISGRGSDDNSLKEKKKKEKKSSHTVVSVLW